jgi:hypothetical protein
MPRTAFRERPVKSSTACCCFATSVAASSLEQFFNEVVFFFLQMRCYISQYIIESANAKGLMDRDGNVVFSFIGNAGQPT